MSVDKNHINYTIMYIVCVIFKMIYFKKKIVCYVGG